MAKELLKAVQIKNAKGAHEGGKKYHKDGGGLFLQVSKTGSKSWVFRRRESSGKVPEVGLGSYPEVSLAEAREIAGEIWSLTSAGVAVKQARDTVKGQKQVEVIVEAGLPDPNTMTFDKAAKRFISEKLEPESKAGTKTVPQWRSSLKEYASPHIGNMDVADIGTDDVMRVLQPIWFEISETASRVRMRMQNILAWCAVMGYRDRDRINPAQWEGHLALLLPAKQKIAPVKHFAALDYKDLPALYAELAAKTSLTAKALRFTLLTGCRTGETIRAEWAEFDDGVWQIPAEKMKAAKSHLVPISTEAANVLNLLDDSGQYVFPAGNKGKRSHGHMSNIAQLKLLKEMRPGTTVHGFRSGFRDWAAETTDHQNFVVEMALAHTIGNAVEAAYRRGSLLEKRARLMEDWSDFLTGKSTN